MESPPDLAIQADQSINVVPPAPTQATQAPPLEATPQPPKRNHTRLLTIILVIALLGMGGLGFYLLHKHSQNQSVVSNSTSTIVPSPASTLAVNEATIYSDQDIVQQLKNLLSQKYGVGKTDLIRKYPYMEWVDSDSKIIPYTGSNFWIGGVDDDTALKIDELNSGVNLDSITFDFLKPMEDDSHSFLENQGFTINQLNTHISQRSESAYRTKVTGFERQDFKCLVTLNEVQVPYFSIECGQIDTDQLALQQQFSSLFKRTYDPSQPANFDSFRVEKIEADYASGTNTPPNLNFGITWVAQKKDGQWKIISTWGDAPTCKEVQAKQIPQSMYELCS